MQSLWGMIGTAVVFHLASLFEARGLPDPEADAAFALGVFAVAMAAAQFLAGVLADRTAAGNLLAVFGVLAAAGCGSLFLIESRPGAWAFAATLGAGQGTLSAGMNVLWPRFFGTAALGAIRGTVQTFSAAACAAGPVLVSLSREHAGGDGPALAGFAGLLLAAGAAGLFLKPPHRPSSREPASGGSGGGGRIVCGDGRPPRPCRPLHGRRTPRRPSSRSSSRTAARGSPGSWSTAGRAARFPARRAGRGWSSTSAPRR